MSTESESERDELLCEMAPSKKMSKTIVAAEEAETAAAEYCDTLEKKVARMAQRPEPSKYEERARLFEIR